MVLFRTTNKVTTYRVNELILLPDSRQMGEEFKDKALVLNNVATFLWDLLQVGTTRDEMINSLLENFDIKAEANTRNLREIVEKEVKFFYETLLYLDLIEEVSDKESSSGKMKEGCSDVSGEKSKLGIFRKPKIYVYDLETGDEKAFGPHVRGASYVHRAVTRIWHGGCC